MGVNICALGCAGNSTVLSRRRGDVTQKAASRPVSRSGLLVSPSLDTSVLPLDRVDTDDSSGEAEGDDRGMFFDVDFTKMTDGFSGPRRSTFDTKLPFFVGSNNFEIFPGLRTDEQVLATISPKSSENTEMNLLERTRHALSTVGGEGFCLSPTSTLCAGSEGQRQETLWQEKGLEQGVYLPRSSGEPSATTASQIESARQASLASDAMSVVDSMTDMSLRSEAHFPRVLKNSNENMRTLVNARAALRKHMNMSMISLQSRQSSGCSLTGHCPFTENESFAVRGAHNLTACGGGLSHSFAHAKGGERFCRTGGIWGNSVLEHYSKPVVSAHSLPPALVSPAMSCTFRRGDSSVDRSSLLELMDHSTTPVSGFLTEDESDASTKPLRLPAVRRVEPFSPPSAAGPNASGHRNASFSATNEPVAADGASVSGTGWVAIGAQTGVGSEEWYARLRARCHLEDSE